MVGDGAVKQSPGGLMVGDDAVKQSPGGMVWCCKRSSRSYHLTGEKREEERERLVDHLDHLAPTGHWIEQ
jgi:hypothetical protein